ncbi:MAG: hypothetical protein V7L09_33610 [Nostoc sp.]|uniref:hypothetical protein n=1 Tax=Nostoc sp. TaxID=1180 RepID=UPI002FF05C0A
MSSELAKAGYEWRFATPKYEILQNDKVIQSFQTISQVLNWLKKIMNEIPQPDPSWDYYLTYHRLLKAKHEMDKLIHFVSNLESATAGLDESINEYLFNLTSFLEDTRISVEPPDES